MTSCFNQRGRRGMILMLTLLLCWGAAAAQGEASVPESLEQGAEALGQWEVTPVQAADVPVQAVEEVVRAADSETLPSLYFALSLGKGNTPDKDAVRVALIEPLLARLYGSDALSGCYQLADGKPMEVWAAALLPDEAAFLQLRQKLAGAQPNNVTRPAAAFDKLCDDLAARALGDPGEKIQLWFIEQRAPLQIRLSDSLNKPRNPLDPLKSAADTLIDLLKAKSGLELRFVYIDSQETAQEDSTLVRFDAYLNGRLAADEVDQGAVLRVFSHELISNTDSESQTSPDSLIGIVRAQWQAGAAEARTVAEKGARENEWILSSERSALAQEATVLAYVSYPGNAGAPPQVYFTPVGEGGETGTQETVYLPADGETYQTQPADPPQILSEREMKGFEAVIGKTSAWFVLRDLPKGKFRIRLVFQEQQADEVPPVMRVYRVRMPAEAWLELEGVSGDTVVWTRDEQVVRLYTDALDVRMDEWQPQLMRNGEPLEQSLMPLDVNAGQPYGWEAVLPVRLLEDFTLQGRLTLRAPGLAEMKTQTLKVQVQNRTPQAVQGAQSALTAIYGVPVVEGLPTWEKPLIIDLDHLFVELDKEDTLSFEILEEGMLTQPPHYRAIIEGRQLSYFPLEGNGETHYVTVLASDGHEKSQPLSIRVTQISLSESMASWRFKADEDNLAVVSVGQPLTLCFRLEGEEALALYDEARKQMSLEPIEDTLKVSVSGEPALKEGAVCRLETRWEGSDNLPGLTIICQLPAFESSVASQQITLAADYQGYMLTELLPPITLQIDNAAPAIREGFTLPPTLSGEIGGAPDRRVPHKLSSLLGKPLDLCEAFVDSETPGQLIYTIRVKGDPAKVLLTRDGIPLEPVDQANPKEYRYDLMTAVTSAALIEPRALEIVMRFTGKSHVVIDVSPEASHLPDAATTPTETEAHLPSPAVTEAQLEGQTGEPAAPSPETQAPDIPTLVLTQEPVTNQLGEQNTADGMVGHMVPATPEAQANEPGLAGEGAALLTDEPAKPGGHIETGEEEVFRCPVEVTFLDAGETTFVITASDGEKTSAELTTNVKLTSSHTRIIWTIMGIALAVLIVAAIASAVIWRARPSFKGLRIKMKTLAQGHDQDPGVVIWLDSYGKGKVSLSALLIACRQPLPGGLGMETLDNIFLKPSHSMQAALVLGKKAAKAEVLVNGSRVKGKKTIPMNARPVLISATNSGEVIHVGIVKAQGGF